MRMIWCRTALRRWGTVGAAVVTAAAVLALALLQVPASSGRSQALPFLATQLDRLHPPAGAQGFPAFARHIVTEAGHPMPVWRYWLLADELTRYFGDAHTLLWPIRTDHQLPLAFYWVQGGLVVLPLSGAPRAVKAGDAVLTMGGQNPSQIAATLSRLISGNRYWVRVQGRALLSTAYGLHWLHLLGRHNQVSLTLQRPNGTVYHVRVSLLHVSKAYATTAQTVVDRFIQRFRAPVSTVPSFSEHGRGAFFSWGIARDGQSGVFVLGTCVDDAAYRHAVQQFFTTMQAHHIPRAVIDLQENLGGNSAVLEPLLQALPAPPGVVVHGYGGSRQVFSALSGGHPYQGHVYVLTSWSTFSSAVMGADVLAANRLATLVGQPTGLAPSALGEVKFIHVPDSPFIAQVSTTYFQAPDHPNATSLVPRISVPLTLADVQTGVNPIARWLASLVAPKDEPPPLAS